MMWWQPLHLKVTQKPLPSEITLSASLAPEATGVTTISVSSPTDVPTVEVTMPPTEDIPATVAAVNATNDAIATSNAVQAAQLTQQANQVIVATSAVPTVLFPSGNLLELIYNSGGFYLRNSSSSTIRDSRLAFQAINASGNGVSVPFDGVDWARFYGNIDSNGHCVALELLDQGSWNRPANCVAPRGSSFNSLLTLPTNDDRIFWLAEDGAVQFIVYWDNSEVARCEIAAGFCQVRVGS